MICESCRENLATVYVSEVLETKKKKVMRLCEGCARERGVDLPDSDQFSVKDFLAKAGEERREARSEPILCPDCGIGLEEFRRTGRLGCARDYAHFRAELLPLLDRIQGARTHTGQAPLRASVRLELEGLRASLETAVASEDYEQAAALRDSIEQLEEGRP
ncbi:MAG: UvrB/UvrC motif-containing protein [Planctomycetes bacterium]|nr:UvrB/UvrC motif-containing protein [Planctomycetota bacterium]